MELVILIGLPGAGKSTFHRERFARTHLLVSKDLMGNHRRPGERQAALLEAALRDGHSVVLDNTNPRVVDRAAPIATANAHGARVLGYWFPADVLGSLRRNAGRPAGARVPPIAVYVTAKRLQPPTKGEGFHELWEVTIDAGRGFRVTAL